TAPESPQRLAPAPPPPPPDAIWGNLADFQSEYNARLGQMGVPGVGDPGFLGDRNAHVFVQAGMYMLAPLPNHDHAMVIRQNSTGASAITNFDYGVVISPRLIFGVQWDNG